MNKISIFIIIILFGLLTYYIGFKIYDCFNINKYICYGFSILLTLIMIFGFMRSMLPIGVNTKNILKVLSSYVMGFYIYLFLYFILSDLVGIVINLLKFDIKNIKLYSGIIVLTLTLVTYAYGLINASNIKIKNYEIKLDEIKNMNIVMISDMHLGAVNSEKRLYKIVEEINKMKADILLICGDIFDNDYYAIKNPNQVIDLLKSIKTKYGVYASLGNHDSGKTFDKMIELLSKSNVKVLMDKSKVIDNKFAILGRLDGTPIGGFKENIARGNIETEINNIDQNLPLIVLDHNPININEYDDRVNLVLSGHTHKGQLFPANIITNSMYEVDYGYYLNNKTHVIVTSGVGTWSMPMRVGSNSEIVNIKIK